MNLIIYDFETSGRSARYDQILQAGIILYDTNLLEIKKLNLKSKINADVIPSINALNVNKIYLSDLLKEKKTSFEIIQEMNAFFEKHRPSMFLGYNSINFDEEFLRQGLWENFLYPYVTTTRDNKRGDVLNLVRVAHALNPDIIKIIEDKDGKLSFKLENISKENNFNIQQSHEAISDVIATKKIFELVKNNAQDIYKDFIDNTDKKKLIDKIKLNRFFSLHANYYGKHFFYLLTHLIDHPVYNDNFSVFDLRYDPRELINLTNEQLSDVFFSGKKKYIRKIKLNKQPSILSDKLSLSKSPYNEIEIEELVKRKKIIDESNLKNRIEKLLVREAENYEESRSQLPENEEETIYKQNINNFDRSIMGKFYNIDWEKRWEFAEKFKDKRLRYFAAKHIFRFNPNFLPTKIFRYFHEKISERFNSIESQNFMTIPAAMSEADNLLLKYENSDKNIDVKNQLEEYDTYINFLNNYYSNKNTNPKPICFDENLSMKLFGK